MRLGRDKKPGFDSEFVGCYLKIKLRGEIDHHTAAAIRNAIDSEIIKKRPRGLIMDMSGVDFMDSSGLGLIMGRYTVIKELGGELIVQDPNSGIERIMNLAGLERIIKIQKSPSLKENVGCKSKRRYEKASMEAKSKL